MKICSFCLWRSLQADCGSEHCIQLVIIMIIEDVHVIWYLLLLLLSMLMYHGQYVKGYMTHKA